MNTRIRTTRTYALLPVTQQTYNEIAARLRAAGYDHVFTRDGAIDLHGLALTMETDSAGEVSGE